MVMILAVHIVCQVIVNLTIHVYQYQILHELRVIERLVHLGANVFPVVYCMCLSGLFLLGTPLPWLAAILYVQVYYRINIIFPFVHPWFRREIKLHPEMVAMIETSNQINRKAGTLQL